MKKPRRAVSIARGGACRLGRSSGLEDEAGLLVVVGAGRVAGLGVPEARTDVVGAHAEAQIEDQPGLVRGHGDGLVHDHQAPDTRRFLDPAAVLAQLLGQQAGDFGVGLGEVALHGFLREAVEGALFVAERGALEDGELGRDAAGRHELLGGQELERSSQEVKAMVLQSFDPSGTRRSVARHLDDDDSVFLLPGHVDLRLLAHGHPPLLQVFR
jgi:hypothetical protein